MAAQDFKFLWTDKVSSLHEPKKQHHFLLQIGEVSDPNNDNSPSGFSSKSKGETDTDTRGMLWYVKSVNKPKFTANNAADEKTVYFFGDAGTPFHNISVLGLEEIKVTAIDPSYPSSTRKLLRLMESYITTSFQFFPLKAKLSTGSIKLFQYSSDAKGNLVLAEEWTFYGCIITEYDFGSLDYSSSELLEISFSFAYTKFKVTMHRMGNDNTETFFSNAESEYQTILENDVPELKKPTAPSSGRSKPTEVGGGAFNTEDATREITYNSTTYIVSEGSDAKQIQDQINNASAGAAPGVVEKLIQDKILTAK